MIRTFLFIVYDIVSHIERKINYFIYLFFILYFRQLFTYCLDKKGLRYQDVQE
jgi:hypothetical protein